MTLRHLYRFGIMLLAALFFAVQSASIAHAASYGDAPHEHDSQICIIGVTADKDDVVVIPDLPQEPNVLITTTVADYTARPYMAPNAQNAVRAPPPRGPPFTL